MAPTEGDGSRRRRAVLALRWPRRARTRFLWVLLAAALVLFSLLSTPTGLLGWAVSGMAVARILLETFEAVPSVRGLGTISLSFNVANLAVTSLSALAFVHVPVEAVIAACAVLATLCHRAVLRRPGLQRGICRRSHASCRPPDP